MGRLLSVNVGLPRDIEWKGRTVHTGIWKSPLPGRCRVRRLNLDGDGQGDLAGHGGEQRAVFVYQIESYRHWQAHLGRDLVPGQLGENFTIEGLADDVVCIGDRYEVGTALFEVTQPRVTCYRVGIRMDDPQMPALLTSSGRPGFYVRVLREGDVGAGDAIVKVGAAAERMTVAEINALLYSSKHPRDRLERALTIDALSPGWRSSFEALLAQSATDTAGSGNAGLAPAAAAHPTAPGFRTVTVASIERESDDVVSFTMNSVDGASLPMALPGQYAVFRLPSAAHAAPLVRSYSLSGPASAERYRISVKRAPNGAATLHLHDHARVGDELAVSAPRGNFVLEAGERPVVLLSAGIGATPLLAMLHALVAARSPREVFWLHGARDKQHHPFADEVKELLRTLAHGRRFVCYSTPGSMDVHGADHDAAGHLSRATLDDVGLPRDADVYVCGPGRFMTEMQEALAGADLAPHRIRTEVFNGGASFTPGVVVAPARAPHPPAGEEKTGPVISFARSGVVAHWNDGAYASILELAEACDVPVRWSCRTGVCHNCESGLVSGAIAYGPEPLDRPADGNLLVCCSRPTGDIVVDL